MNKILLISDDIRVTSGVANFSRELMKATKGKIEWIQMASAPDHPEQGKSVEHELAKLHPVHNYGNIWIVRQLLKNEKPDVLMLFTDPKRYPHIWAHENEIRKTTPISYLHVWDSLPDPLYNRYVYESVDQILAISKLTLGIAERMNVPDLDVRYFPHFVDTNVFKPLEDTATEIREAREALLGGRRFDYVVLTVARNQFRKRLIDSLRAWNEFIGGLSTEEADKCAYVLKTEAKSIEGTDLPRVMRDLRIKGNVILIDNNKLNDVGMSALHNLSDVYFSMAHSEGFGIPSLEALACEKPIIIPDAGGERDKMGEWAITLPTATVNVAGSVWTPYLEEVYADVSDGAGALEALYRNPGLRKTMGMAGRQFVLSPKSAMSAEIGAGNFIKAIDAIVQEWTPPRPYIFGRL